MDVRVLILGHLGNIFQASVMTQDLARMSNEMYPSKLVCAIDLLRIGLLTIMDQDDVLQSDFETRDKILMTHTTIEADVLEEAGFVEIIPAKVN